MSRHITEKVCYESGHKMITLEIGKPLVDPVSKVALFEKVILCEKCGLSMEQIQNYRPIPKSRKAKQS